MPAVLIAMSKVALAEAQTVAAARADAKGSSSALVASLHVGVAGKGQLFSVSRHVVEGWRWSRACAGVGIWVRVAVGVRVQLSDQAQSGIACTVHSSTIATRKDEVDYKLYGLACFARQRYALAKKKKF